ncbi:MAG TPA: DUF4956 domain-containing protein [Aeromicrobium sp.]|nr:DUF4956 domain-containing protein [Aeromicrobium sp.]
MGILVAASDPLGTAGGDAVPSVGWEGFLNLQGMVDEFTALVLATLLALIISFHPTTRQTVDTIEEAELPKVSIMYALVGALVGVAVLQFGTVIGFVVFGLGGLMRFRTETASTRDTGRLIIVTLIGLICGMNLPHFAIIATAFVWIIILVFDGNPVYRLDVTEVPKDQLRASAQAYRAELDRLGAKLVSENNAVSKGKLVFVFQAPRSFRQDTLYEATLRHIPPELRGELDWRVE